MIFYNSGSTETGGLITQKTSKSKYIDSVGFAFTNVQVKFVDMNSNKSLGPNEVGEIYTKTSAMMMEYYKSPKTTRKVIDKEGKLHQVSFFKYYQMQ